MTEFKVGDRVRYLWDGDEGDVKEITDTGLLDVEFDDDGRCKVEAHEIELVESFEDTVQEYSSFEQSVNRITGDIANLLILKNKAYGDSALNPVRVFSKASRIEQLNVRIDDKISRIQRGTDYEDEDTVRDLIGYLVLRLIAEESE
ncbi:hypothetical protein SEA_LEEROYJENKINS_15 [Microbacterium phage LeeroyJenkins]|nr:hypothetical protein SEA_LEEROYJENKINS_15 [Microbacterium phage LeeroyJenkins]